MSRAPVRRTKNRQCGKPLVRDSRAVKAARAQFEVVEQVANVIIGYLAHWSRPTLERDGMPVGMHGVNLRFQGVHLARAASTQTDLCALGV